MERIYLRPPDGYHTATVFGEAHRRGVPVMQVIAESFADARAKAEEDPEQGEE